MRNKIVLAALALLGLFVLCGSNTPWALPRGSSLFAPISIATAQSSAEFKEVAKAQSALSKKGKTTCAFVSNFAEGAKIEFSNWINDEEAIILSVFINANHPSAKNEKKLLAMVGEDDWTLEYSNARVDGGKGRESAGSYLTFKKREPARTVPKKK